MKRDVIYLSIIGCLISVIWLNIETMGYLQQKYYKELKQSRDSLSKANGLIKLNGFKWPSEL